MGIPSRSGTKKAVAPLPRRLPGQHADDRDTSWRSGWVQEIAQKAVRLGSSFERVPTGPREDIRHVFAIIVHFNTPLITAACVEDLSSLPGVRVVVLDNHSDADNWDLLSAACEPFPGTVLYRSQTNLGFGAGVNRAVSLLSAGDRDYIWLVNSDMRPVGNPVPPLIRAIDEEHFDIVAPCSFSDDSGNRSVYFVGGSLDRLAVTTSHWQVGEPFDGRAGDPVQCSYINGASMMFPSSVWRRLGGFREDLFLYWEDAALSFEAHRLGLKLGIIPSAVMWHQVGGSSSDKASARAAHFLAARNRIIVGLSWGVSLSSFVIGRAAPETYKTVLRPLIRSRSDRLAKSFAALRGNLSGLTRPHLAPNVCIDEIALEEKRIG